jgi:ribonuclease HI
LSAVFNTLIVGYMPDYTCLVTPLFRAMEFYLHRILSDKLGKTTTTSKGRNNFSYFTLNNVTKKYEYNSSWGNLNNDQIDYLNELYNRYNRMRHPYAHWAENSLDTHVITDIKTARDLITEGLQFINKYYIIF